MDLVCTKYFLMRGAFKIHDYYETQIFQHFSTCCVAYRNIP